MRSRRRERERSSCFKCSCLWGIIITYIQPEEYVKKTIVDSTSTTLLTTLDETLKTLDYTGKAIYLPPRYLNDPQSIKAYIPKEDIGPLPSPETTQKLEMQLAHKNAQGMLITRPGAELAILLEAELGTSLLRMNLLDLQQRLPRTLIENLEITTNCDIRLFASKTTEQLKESAQSNQNAIFVKFTTTTFKDTCRKATKLSMIFSNIGCPLSSVFAIAFAKATGKPVSITAQNVSEDGEENETEYTIVEEFTA